MSHSDSENRLVYLITILFATNLNMLYFVIRGDRSPNIRQRLHIAHLSNFRCRPVNEFKFTIRELTAL